MITNIDDKTAFLFYPKYNWVYQTTTLMDDQQIKWSPFKDEHYKTGLPILNLESSGDKVYIQESLNDMDTVDVLIYRGELKWSSKQVEGSIKLRLYSIMAKHLMKFSGILRVKHDHNIIVGLSLSFTEEDFHTYPKEVKSKIEKIYSK
jgi:hypothetical protein